MPKANKYGADFLTKYPGSEMFHVAVPVPKKVKFHPLLLNGKGKPQKVLQVSLNTDSVRVARQLAPSIVMQLKHRIKTATDGYSNELHLAARYGQRLKHARSAEDKEVILAEWTEELERLLPPLSPRHDGSYEAYQLSVQKDSLTGYVHGSVPKTMAHYDPADAITTDAYLEDWLSFIKPSEGNAIKMRVSIKRIAAEFLTLKLITKGSVTRWFGDLLSPADGSKPLSHGSVTYIRTHGRQYWNFLEQREIVDDGPNPFEKAALPPAPAKSDTQYRPFTDKECAAVYDYARNVSTIMRQPV